ncbi:MAG: RNA helicase, partial [Anabaena sp. CRKS33]
YVHRIGRTGRAGAEGEAISLVCVDEHHLLADIEKLIQQRLPKEVVAGFAVNPEIKAEPIPNGRKAPAGGGSRTPRSVSQKSPQQPSSRTAAGGKKSGSGSGSGSSAPRRSGKGR